jgi:hypothetical protein
MPSESISQALKESYAQANAADVYLETLAVSSRAPGSSGAKTLDLSFVIDDTSSMGSFLATVQNIIGNLAEALTAEFTSVRYSLVRFKDEGDTVVVTDFITDAVAFIAFIDALTPAGGGDGPENGYGATVMACEDLTWRNPSSLHAKVVWLITDQFSHERGATETEALQALEAQDAVFILGAEGTFTYNYDELILQTGGEVISFSQADEEVLAEFLAIVAGVAGEETPLFFIVNAPVSYDFALVAGGGLHTFDPLGFKLTLPGQNDQGVQSLNVSIDNTDRRIGDLVESFAVSGEQMVLDYRIYLKSDPTTPQNDPALQLVMSNVKSTLFAITGSATFADIVNMQFLTIKYTRKNFPGLGN